MIGVGDVTKKKSAPSFNKIAQSALVAVGSRTPENARRFAIENGIRKCYDNPLQVIDDQEVNAVYIATPPGSHAEYALKAIEAGKPAYIEKPMARTYQE
jgi:1,5-anhydro-D-fructose reductase (1,5-anhydro-D-mannitol-forming)